MAVTVRLFAAAREAAGTDSLEVPAGPLVLPDLGPGFDKVVGVCTLLCDGRRVAVGDELTDGSVVDVLPPFAGG